MTSPAPGHLAAFTAVGGGSALVLLFLMNLVYLDWFDAGGGIVAIWGGIILLLSALLAIVIFGLSTLILWRLPPLTTQKMRARAIAITSAVTTIILSGSLIALGGINCLVLLTLMVQIGIISSSAVLAAFFTYPNV